MTVFKDNLQNTLKNDTKGAIFTCAWIEVLMAILNGMTMSHVILDKGLRQSPLF